MSADMALYRVVAGGVDISDVLFPFLQRLTVNDKAGTTSDNAEIEIDDANGVVAMPDKKAPVVISLGRRSRGIGQVFEGTVTDVRSIGDRGGGQRLLIIAKGADTTSKVKQSFEKHWDDKPLSAVLKEAAELAGLSKVVVDPSLGKLMRPYWAMNGESFLHFGHRLSEEVGGTFKIVGKTAILAARNGGVSASGLALPTVVGARGVNLIDWDISPIVGRPRYNYVRVRWYDTKEAKWREERVQVNDMDADAELTMRHTRANKDEAKTHADSAAKESERNKGGGSATIDGDINAQPEGGFALVGARPGADGLYKIDQVTHELARGTGFLTRLSLKNPSGEAGKDTRGQKGGKGSGSSLTSPNGLAGEIGGGNVA
ncbi:late control protein [Rhodopseudomonas palustris]|nr:late control protein [Rhodopseudomonas palustris]